MARIRLFAVLILMCLLSNATAQEMSFEELKAQRTREVCIHYLDGYLCLSQEQHIALDDILKENWKPDSGSTARVLLWGGYNSSLDVFLTLKKSNLEDTLSEEQLQQFESLDEVGLVQSRQADYLRRRTNPEVDPIKPSLDHAIELELKRMEKLLQLDAEQLRLLRVAAKGAAKQIFAERANWREKIATDERVARGADWVKVAVESPAFRIRESEVWITTLKKVLSEKQFTTHLNDQATQSKVAARASVHSIVMTYFHRKKISREDYENFTKMLEDEIANAMDAGIVEKHGSIAFDAVGVLVELEDEQIKKTLSEESWQIVKPILENIRATRERARRIRN